MSTDMSNRKIKLTPGTIVRWHDHPWEGIQPGERLRIVEVEPSGELIVVDAEGIEARVQASSVRFAGDADA